VQQVGRYQIIEELGRGAMGVVYKALDPAIGRTVAIKTIQLNQFQDPAERKRVHERLLLEAQSAGVLSHPNIVTIYDVMEEPDAAHIFMEYVSGTSLGRMLAQGKLPQRALLLEFLKQVAEALDYAHRKGVVHRDIKPGNVIISTEAEGARVPLAKIADFGVAKFVSHEMTHSGTMIGTPNYMSPEQIQGLTVDGRSDQFSFAVVVYELLTGAKPFAAEGLPSLFYQICKEDLKPADQVKPELDATVAAALARALAKEPERRFSSCTEFIDAVIGEAQERVYEPTIAASAMPVSAPELLPLNRPRRYEESDRDAREQPRWSGRKIGLILAMCLAIGAAVSFLARWNWGPNLPAQTLDTASSTVSRTPEDLETDKRVQGDLQTDLAKRNAAQQANKDKHPAIQSPVPKQMPTNPLIGEVEMLTEPPGAKLTVDGKSDTACASPCTLQLPSGRHTLTAELEGYNLARRIFNVPEDNSVFVPMAKSMGVLLVTSEPDRAMILVDGKDYGQTPATLHLTPGSHHLQLINGTRRHDETIVIQSDGFEARAIRWD